MKDKNIYDLLNDVEMDLSEYEEVDLSDKEKEKFKKNFDKSINKKKGKKKNFLQVAAAAALVLALSLGFINEDVRANVVSTLESVNYSIGQALGLENGERGYRLDQAVLMGEYELKITDLLMDENSITLNYLVDGNENFGEAHSHIFINDILLRVNGKTVGIKGAQGSGGPLKEGIESSVETYEFSKPIELENTNEITLKIKGLADVNEIKTDDTAEFIFVASRDELLAGAKEIEIDKEIQVDNGNITIHKLVLHPIMSKIYFSAPNEEPSPSFPEVELSSASGDKLVFNSGSYEFNKESGKLECYLYGIGNAGLDLKKEENISIQLYLGKEPIGQPLQVSLAKDDTEPVGTYNVNQTQNFAGIEIKLTDLVLDEKSLQFNYLLEAPTIHDNLPELNRKSSALYYSSYVDGLTIKINDEIVEAELADGRYDILEEGLESALETYNFTNKVELKDTNKVEIIFNKLDYSDLANDKYEVVEGNASFVVEGSIENMKAGSLTLEEEVTIPTDYGDFTIDQVKLHPYETGIIISAHGRDGQAFDFPNEYFLGAKITLDDGEELNFSNFSGYHYDEENNKEVFDLYFDGMISETEINPYPRESVEDSQTFILQLQLENINTRERIDIGKEIELDMK